MADNNLQGPGVLLLHGQPGSVADWRLVQDQLEPLLGPGVPVLVPERMGYGNSDSEAGGFAANADAAIALLDEAGISSVVVAAQSWAGGIALDMATRYPDRVTGLVLVSSVGPEVVDFLDRLLLRPRLGRVLARASVGVSGLVVHRSFRPLFVRVAGVDERRSARAIIRDNPNHRLVDTFLTEQRALVDELPGVLANAAQINAPVIVLTANNDHVVPARISERLVSGLPNATLRLIPRAGHFVLHRAPAEVARAIEELHTQ